MTYEEEKKVADVIVALTERIGTLESENDRLLTLTSDLRLQAQTHAMEARGANSKIAEIYQIISGGKGEPGNWRGAKPVREYVEAAKGEIMRLETELALSKPVYSRRQLEVRAEAAEAEVKRLEAEIDRESSMPGDHRYWEGRYRDEAAENEKLREALTPFVLAFESRRETYSKRYRSNRQLGYANFDKMPDDWAMEKVAFSMGTYRCAHKALSSAGRDPLKEFDALVEGPSFTEIASTGGEHHAE